jgi:hypothetical protein
MSDKNDNTLGETLGNVAKKMGDAAGSVSQAMGEAAGSVARTMGEVTGNAVEVTANAGQSVGQSVGLLDRNDDDETTDVTMVTDESGTVEVTTLQSGESIYESDTPSAEGTSC